MRTASICPTCAIYENAKCILYDGSALSNIDVAPLDSLETALENINTTFDSVVYKATSQTITGQKQFNPDTLAIKNVTNGEIAEISYSAENDSSKVIFPIGVYDGSEYTGTVVYRETLPKMYIATVSQDTGIDDVPVLTVVKNDFSGTISAAYNSAGSFEIGNSLPEFTTGKTTIKLSSSGNVGKDLGATTSTTQVALFYSRDVNGTLSNDLLLNDLLEITVYP